MAARHPLPACSGGLTNRVARLMTRRAVLLLATGLALAACAPALTPVAAPTQTLIPPTASPPTVPAGALPATATPEVLIPAGAQALVNRAIQDLAAHLELSSDQIEVIGFEAITWPDVSLGCDAAASAQVETPGYRLVLRSGDALYEYHSDAGDRVRQCHDVPAAEATTAVGVDPMVAELVMMAQQRLAADLDLSTRRIQVDAIEPMTWTDTSLNCPSADVTYEPARIEGYRLVLSAGEEPYIFHSDFERLVACAPGQEQLPEATVEAGG